jgi:hypothetical protein
MKIKHVVLAALAAFSLLGPAILWAAPTAPVPAPTFTLGPVGADWSETGIVLATGEEIAGFPLIGSARALLLKKGEGFFLLAGKDRYGPFKSTELVLPSGYSGSRVAFAALEPVTKEYNGWFVYLDGKKRGPYSDVGAIAAAPDDRFAFAVAEDAGQGKGRFFLEVEGEDKPRFEYEDKTNYFFKCFLAWDPAGNDFTCLMEANYGSVTMLHQDGKALACSKFYQGFLVAPGDGRLAFAYAPVSDGLARVRNGTATYGPYKAVSYMALNRNGSLSYLALADLPGQDGKMERMFASYTDGIRLPGPAMGIKGIDKPAFAAFYDDGTKAAWGLTYIKRKMTESQTLELLQKMNSGEKIDSMELLAGTTVGFIGDKGVGPFFSLNVERFQDETHFAYTYENGGGYWLVRDGSTFGPFPGRVSTFESNPVYVAGLAPTYSLSGGFEYPNLKPSVNRDAEASIERISRTATAPIYKYRTTDDSKGEDVLMRGKEKVGTFYAVFAATPSADGKSLVYAAKAKENSTWTIFVNGKKRSEKGALEAFAIVPGGDEPVYVIFDKDYQVGHAGKKYGPFTKVEKDYDSHHYGFSFAKGGSVIAFGASMPGTKASTWIIANGKLYPGIVDPVLDEVRFFAGGKVWASKGIR